ncbi:MFS transporter [Flavipsychrobacter stenotrophus]|uniref:MFS transporter n=1 Tax=Flavipsychrobacter stenotrophus TaxID=2077091 RepID=A0A2S7T157_9BACT|nr:MFS transporter [Flavipsychrobacter stenotrophus]PQJ12939.1 MFS transporter [Flavipsychrobacter stenotrophus]
MQKKNIILIIGSMGILVEALDIAIINLALPSIQQEFALTGAGVQWLQSLYILFYGGFLIIGGKLSDVYGTKKMFLLGSGLFLFTSLGAGLSPTYSSLLVFRAIQGLAAAMVMPAAFSLISHTFTDLSERGRAMGIFSSFAAIGSGSGLSLGGVITSYCGWQWVFIINVPILAIVILFGYALLDVDSPSRTGERPDLLSGFFLVSGLVMVTICTQLLAAPADNIWYIASLVVLIVLFAATLKTRLGKKENPLIDLCLFRIPSLVAGNVSFLLLGAFFTGYLFIVSMVLQYNLHITAAKAGIILVPFSLLSVLVARFVAPHIMPRIPVIATAMIGMACMLTGSIFLMAAIYFTQLSLLLCGAASIAGFGITLCFTGFSVMSMQQIPAMHYGVGSSLTSTSFFFGGGVGLPLLTIFIKNGTNIGVAPIIVLAAFASVALVFLVLYMQKVNAQNEQITGSAIEKIESGLTAVV